MYDKLINTALNCLDSNKKCEGCLYENNKYSECLDKLISDLTEALMIIESYNAWNEEAARHLKAKIDRIQFIEEKR